MKAIEHRQHHLAELEAEKATARLQHPPGLSQGFVDPRHIAQAERDRVSIEAAIGERELLGISTHPPQALEPPTVERSIPSHLQHILCQVADDDRSLIADAVTDPEGNVASAPCHVDHLPTRTWPQPGNHFVLPQSVNARRHEVVHQVVTAGYVAEDSAHPGGFLGFRDLAKTKMGGWVLC